MKQIIIFFMIFLMMPSINAYNIIHRRGTNIEANRELLLSIDQSLFNGVDKVDFRTDKDLYNGYYSFEYYPVNNRGFKTEIKMWCLDRDVLLHELGHHDEQRRFQAVNLSEEYAWGFAKENMEG